METLQQIANEKRPTSEQLKKAGLTRKRFQELVTGENFTYAFETSRITKLLGLTREQEEKFFLKNIAEYISKPTKKYQRKSTYKKRDIPKLEGDPCVRCNEKVATERAHYDGPWQHKFGKGLGMKSNDLLTAELCHDCHVYFHNPKERKSIERSEELMGCILLSIIRREERKNGQ